MELGPQIQVMKSNVQKFSGEIIMNTTQDVIFKVHTARFVIRAKEEKLFIIRGGNSELLDNYDMDTDPVDYVADDVTEMFIELCPCDITTDNEVIALGEEVYTAINMFYLMRGLKISAAKRV